MGSLELAAGLVLLGAVICHAQAPEPANFPAFQVGFNASALATSNISYTDGTSNLRGFLAYDKTSNSTRPGVLVIPDYDGIGPYEYWRAKQLADLGYVAFVADIYSQDVVQGPSMPAAQRSALTQVYNKNPTLWVSRLHAGLDELRNQPFVDSEMMAAYGYCFGGGGAIQLMLSYPNNTEGLLGVVGFHPSLPTMFPGPLEMNNPIRGAFFLGYLDMGAMPAAVDGFKSTLNNLNASWSLTEFGQTVHAFTEPNQPLSVTNMPSAGTGYNPESDVFSWWSARGFLRDIFGVTGGQNGNVYTEAVMPGIEVA